MHKSRTGSRRLVQLIALMGLASGACGDDSVPTDPNTGLPSDRVDTSVDEEKANPGDGDGDDQPPFTFDRAAVLGDWPTTSRLIRSTCDSAQGSPADPASGTTKITAINDQVVEIRRPNAWRALGALDRAESTLESTWMEPDGTPVNHKLAIEFKSLKEFVATSTMTVERSEQVPDGCEAVVEDHASRP